MALSRDLRLRIVDLVATGVSRREAGRRFKVAASTAVRLVRQATELGHVEVKKPARRKSKLDPFGDGIIGWITGQPDMTLAEICARLKEEHNLRVGSSTLDDWLRGKQVTYKKNGSRQ